MSRTSMPSIVTDASVDVVEPRHSMAIVVLPEPLGPTSAASCPGYT